MVFILTGEGVIACPHGGVGKLSSLGGQADLKIGSANVLAESNVGAVSFSCSEKIPCVTVVQWMPNQSSFRCKGGVVLTDRSIPITNNGKGEVKDPGQNVFQLNE